MIDAFKVVALLSIAHTSKEKMLSMSYQKRSHVLHVYKVNRVVKRLLCLVTVISTAVIKA